MMGRSAAMTLLLGLWICASLPAAAAAVAVSRLEVTDDRGRVIHLDHPPARIVSLLPSLTETVCELGACTRLVGTDRYSNWPDSVKSLPKLGGLDDAMLERIVVLHPDVVLASDSSRVVDRLDELGVPVIALRSKTLADVHRMLDLVAELLGMPGRGDAAWRGIQAKIAAAATRVPPVLRGRRVFFEVSDAPHAASASSFIGELLAMLGLGNVVPGDLGPFPELNPEFVVRAQPDLIMASDVELAQMATRPGWDALEALRSSRTCGFPAAAFDILVRPGPRLGEAADEIVQCLTRLGARGAQ
jgi:iron complex transport system substrate-binding protein